MDTSSRSMQTKAESLSCVVDKTADSKAQATEADKLSEAADGATSEQQAPGKIKKTAFRFFGGRKSICTLPSFFGVKHKGHTKSSSKKGIGKSKTHDCISDVNWEDVGRAGELPVADFEYHSQKHGAADMLTCSQSVHSINSNKKSDALLCSNSEFSEQKLSSEKSLPRPKKGLKSLFSIRRNKKNKEKSEPSEFSPRLSVKAASTDHVKAQTESPDSLPESLLSIALIGQDKVVDKPECTEDVNVKENSTLDVGSNMKDPYCHNSDIFKDVDLQEMILEVKVDVDGGILCVKSEMAHLSEVCQDYTDHDPSSVRSSDQISLMFGDVSSLKSFDSLTGCGDIVADQDDESMAESTVSAERGRNAGKRSSCYITYQGGGEEMASPDEVDEYLQGLWDGEAAADVCYTPGEHQHVLEDIEMHSSLGEAGISSPHICYPEIAKSAADGCTVRDLLTPQSDQLESAPNSDEGYYDSTTPGPDDESMSRIRKERLPRDSYSGDALYELYEPDDSLMSPPLEDEPSFDTQPPSPDSFEFLGVSLGLGNKILESSAPDKMCQIETEEARLVVIQKELMAWGVRRMKKSVKEQACLSKERIYPDRTSTECKPKSGKKHQGCLENEQLQLQSVKAGRAGAHEKLRPGSQSHSGNYTTVKAPSGDLDPSNGTPTSHQMKELPLQARNCKLHKIERKGKDAATEQIKNNVDLECDQAVSFSQALVDFTNNTKLFSDFSKGLGSSDSGSSFAHNIQVLPTMVTFDVVDMENEEECDQQIEMVPDEDMESPFEPFDDSYLQKDAIAECDERMFDMYDQISFLSGPWGVASLPRQISFSKEVSAKPLPLSLNRRSRSLDIESLECEISDSYLLKCAPDVRSSSQVPRRELYTRKVSSTECKRNVHSSLEAVDLPSEPWQKEINYSVIHPKVDSKKVQGSQGTVEEKMWSPGKPTDGLDQQCGECTSSWDVPVHDSSQKFCCSGSSKSVSRPSQLSLRLGDDQIHKPVSNISESCRENPYKQFVLASPLEERSENVFTQNSALQYVGSSRQPSKCKPVGITQGMPHCRQDEAPTSELFEASSKGQSELVQTGWGKCTLLDL
ncbi:AMER1 protein, partial [Polypterus senegalus]|nr:APC membrane recruitment protein 1 [Polypterus senegalus]MBN3289940.1 AMER1 protein [Polypterus senegalus]